MNPLLKTLSPKARLASPFIRRGVREGLSFNQIRTVLRKHELGLTSSELSPIVRAERALNEHGRNLRYLPFDARPNPARLPISITATTRRYSYTVQAFGYAADSGISQARHITISTDILLTRREAESAAVEAIVGQFENYAMEVETVQLEFVQESSLYRPFG